MKSIYKWLITLFLIVILIVMIFPMLYMLLLSFQKPGTFAVSLNDFSLTLKNYATVFKSNNFGRYFFNSTLIAVLTTLGNMLLCAMIGYGLSRGPRKITWPLFMLAVAMLMIPAHVLILPIFQMMIKLRWFDTYWALIVPWLVSPFAIFLMKQYIDGLPTDLEDAARVDGASDWTIFIKVILPLSKPALATLTIFAFMGSWKDFLWPLIVTNRVDMRTVEVGIASFSNLYTTDWPHQMAAAVVVMLPIIIVFMFAQKYFVKGITMTGIKG